MTRMKQSKFLFFSFVFTHNTSKLLTAHSHEVITFEFVLISHISLSVYTVKNNFTVEDVDDYYERSFETSCI